MKAIGRENIWFAFKNIRNDTLKVRMLSMPTRPHPARKGKVVDIPGADDLWQDGGGYKRIIVPIRLITEDNANIDDVNAWLSGEGWLVFGDEPARAYRARITKEFSRSNRSQRLRGQEFTVSFDCEPYRYSADPTFESITLRKVSNALSSSTEVVNTGTLESLPLLKVSGGSEGTVRIGVPPTDLNGGVELAFTGLEPGKPVYVNCAAKLAYTGEGTVEDPYVLANHLVSGDWPQIPTGSTYAIISGDIDELKITPNWRWL